MTTEAPVRDKPLPLRERDLMKGLTFDQLKRSLKNLLLTYYVGEANAVSQEKLKSIYHVKDTRRLRLAIWSLNVDDKFPICSVTGGNKEPTGYYFPANVQEAADCQGREQSRAKKIFLRVSNLPENTATYYAGTHQMELGE